MAPYSTPQTPLELTSQVREGSDPRGADRAPETIRDAAVLHIAPDLRALTTPITGLSPAPNQRAAALGRGPARARREPPTLRPAQARRREAGLSGRGRRGDRGRRHTGGRAATWVDPH